MISTYLVKYLDKKKKKCVKKNKKILLRYSRYKRQLLEVQKLFRKIISWKCTILVLFRKECIKYILLRQLGKQIFDIPPSFSTSVRLFLPLTEVAPEKQIVHEHITNHKKCTTKTTVWHLTSQNKYENKISHPLVTTLYGTCFRRYKNCFIFENFKKKSKK